ncbi:MAG: membrane protein insertase YidC [Microbacteriaceae bacterium]
MDFLGTLLWPIKWAIELILVSFHTLGESIGFNPDAGITWVLSIVGLVLVVRAALIPVFVKQIKSQRKMMEIAPEVRKIQDKYKGKKDQLSREAMNRETMALYSKHKTSPLSGCLPLLIQMPIFFGLYSVLNDAQHDKAGVGLLSQALANSFATSEFLGAPLKATLMQAVNGDFPSSTWSVILVAATMVILMTASQFITQLQIMSRNLSPEAKTGQAYQMQRVMLYILPLVFIISGVAFPLGVMFYWLTSNFWTMGQQFLVIRNMPTPGSEAAKAREERLARRRQKKGLPADSEAKAIESAEAPKPIQRQQPVNKNRSKKQGKKK